MPKISIIVAAYNVDKYLEICINSIVSQTLHDIEIIIVNDGSTDNTSSIIEKFKRKDERIIVIEQENYGISTVRNIGLSKATGEYILFIDGDDWIEKNSLIKLYNLATKENADVVCYNFFYAYRDQNKISKDFKVFDKLNKDEFIKASLLLDVAPVLWCKLLRRDLLQVNNIKCPEDISFGEDMAMSIDIALNAKNILFLNEPLYYYRQREDSVSKELSEKVLTIEKSMEFIEKRLKEHDKNNLFLDEYQFIVYRNMYYYLVINNKVNKVQYKLYKMWKNKKIDIKNNKYYIDFKTNFNTKLKIKHALYDKSYYLGFLYSKTIENIKKIIN